MTSVSLGLCSDGSSSPLIIVLPQKLLSGISRSEPFPRNLMLSSFAFSNTSSGLISCWDYNFGMFSWPNITELVTNVKDFCKPWASFESYHHQDIGFSRFPSQDHLAQTICDCNKYVGRPVISTGMPTSVLAMATAL